MNKHSSKEIKAVEKLNADLAKVRSHVKEIIFGQDEVIDKIIITLLSGGHTLLVGLPGLAKTRLVRSLGTIMGLTRKRIQFTPDLMPTDILGSEILEETARGKRSFKFIEGPVFSQFLLADEINRASPRTQSALLQAMQERRVTVAGKNYDLPEPFHVLATQNPIEQEGTYPLPEAQLDRFMFNLVLDYPSFDEELKVVENTTSNKITKLSNIIDISEILKYQELIRKVPVTKNVIEYAVKIVSKSRPNTNFSNTTVNDFVSWGAGPRASQFLILGAKCHALVNGKYSPDIEDVKSVAIPILRHRIVRNYTAEAEGYTIEKIIKSLL